MASLGRLLTLGVFLSGPGLLTAERYLFAKSQLPLSLGEDSGIAGLPRAAGLVFLINGIGGMFLMTYLTFRTAPYRKRLIAKAKKDGDEHAEARFTYPKLIAEGFSDEAKIFNSVLRGHTHALEWYPIFLAFSAIGCLYHPLTTAAMGALWIAARAAWAHGYSSDPLGVGAIGRYRNSYGLGLQVWSSILVLMMAAASTSLAVLGVYDAVPSLF